MRTQLVERLKSGLINVIYDFLVRPARGCGTPEAFADLDDQSGELARESV